MVKKQDKLLIAKIGPALSSVYLIKTHLHDASGTVQVRVDAPKNHKKTHRVATVGFYSAKPQTGLRQRGD